MYRTLTCSRATTHLQLSSTDKSFPTFVSRQEKSRTKWVTSVKHVFRYFSISYYEETFFRARIVGRF